jgi:hypothetical protein
VDQLLSVRQLSQQLNLPASWLRAEALADRIPCLRVGRRLRFSLTAVTVALQERAAGREVAARAQ